MTDRKALYSKKGSYAGYDKKNKERDALDYYSTPTEEVINILETLPVDFTDSIILEPSCGGLHMVKGIDEVTKPYQIIATDIQERAKAFDDFKNTYITVDYGKQFDFLSDDYPHTDNIDYIVMNPPYSVIEPFTMKALSIANKGVLMLGRLQFLEGEGRFKNIFSNYPPTDVYVYVDRIACFKNGDTSIKPDSIQAYAWFYWDFTKPYKNTSVHWLRRANKKNKIDNK
jgi:hypothetical protein